MTQDSWRRRPGSRRRTAGGGPAVRPFAVSSARAQAQRWNVGDFVFKYLTLLFALLVLSLVFLMAYEMYAGSGLSIAKVRLEVPYLEHLGPGAGESSAPFHSSSARSRRRSLALLIALPLASASRSSFPSSVPAWLERPLSFLVELLAAIPSIVYGLWGIFVLVPWLRITVEPFLASHSRLSSPSSREPAYGFGMLAAGLILAIMILPIITSISRDVLQAIPNLQREAALALGATRWETTRIILSSAKSGILGATLLGLGRAVGETMAVTMVIGNRPEIAASLFDPGLHHGERARERIRRGNDVHVHERAHRNRARALRP